MPRTTKTELLSPPFVPTSDPNEVELSPPPRISRHSNSRQIATDVDEPPSDEEWSFDPVGFPSWALGSIDYRNMPTRPSTPGSSHSRPRGLSFSPSQRDPVESYPGQSFTPVAVSPLMAGSPSPPPRAAASSTTLRRQAGRRSQSPKISQTVKRSQPRTAAHARRSSPLSVNPFVGASRLLSTRVSRPLFPEPTNRADLRVRLRLLDIDLAVLGLERERLALLLSTSIPSSN